MTYFIKPENGESIRNNNIVIGYYKEKAIIKNDDDELFYVECDENQAPQGTVIENGALTPISTLNIKEQQEIITIYYANEEE